MPHINEEQISSYLDKQLCIEETRSFEAHVGECESCRAVYEQMREVTRLFREAERFEPSPFLWNRIAADFDSKRPAALDWRASIIAGLRNYGWNRFLAAATLAIMLFVGVAIFRIDRGHIADRAALAEIDRVYRSLAAQDPDAYNPFSSGSPGELDANPFRSLRLGGGADKAPPAIPRH